MGERFWDWARSGGEPLLPWAKDFWGWARSGGEPLLPDDELSGWRIREGHRLQGRRVPGWSSIRGSQALISLVLRKKLHFDSFYLITKEDSQDQRKMVLKRKH